MERHDKIKDLAKEIQKIKESRKDNAKIPYDVIRGIEEKIQKIVFSSYFKDMTRMYDENIDNYFNTEKISNLVKSVKREHPKKRYVSDKKYENSYYKELRNVITSPELIILKGNVNDLFEGDIEFKLTRMVNLTLKNIKMIEDPYLDSPESRKIRKTSFSSSRLDIKNIERMLKIREVIKERKSLRDDFKKDNIFKKGADLLKLSMLYSKDNKLQKNFLKQFDMERE